MCSGENKLDGLIHLPIPMCFLGVAEPFLSGLDALDKVPLQ